MIKKFKIIIGIVNGRSGTIKDIIYPISKNNETLPDTIIVHIPDYTGPQFFSDKEKQFHSYSSTHTIFKNIISD